MTAHSGKGWALAPSLITLETEANLHAPNRGKASDGSVGDMAHADRGSRHNTTPFVRALDLTHSPERGFDAIVVADLIAARCVNGLEDRVLGIGSWDIPTQTERWFARRNGVWSWITHQQLHGATHRTHMHLEVVDSTALLSTKPWGLLAPKPAPPTPKPKEAMIITTESGSYTSDGISFVSGGLQPQSLAEAFRKAGVTEVKMSNKDLEENFVRVQRP